jgi:hypothetical protein
MSGQFNIGGHTILEHTGVEGAGEVALQNVSFPAGHVVQVLQSVKTDTDSTRSGFGSGFADITGTDQNGSGNIFCVKITPKYNTSKIMITPSINAGGAASNFVYLRLVRDSTPIFVGDLDGARIQSSTMSFSWSANEGVVDVNTFTFLDSPTINNTPQEFIYKIQYVCASNGDNVGNAYINRSHRDTASTYYDARTASSITVMEISQ